MSDNKYYLLSEDQRSEEDEEEDFSSSSSPHLPHRTSGREPHNGTDRPHRLRDSEKIGGVSRKIHPLAYNYCVWANNNSTKGWDSYGKNLKLMGSFNTCEDFWRFKINFLPFHLLPIHSDWLVFREGIKPMWEDDANKNGGRWLVRMERGLGSRVWENLLIAMIGQQFPFSDEICGVIASIRPLEEIISLWNKSSWDIPTIEKIRVVFAKVIDLLPGTIIEYKAHETSTNHQNLEDKNYTLYFHQIT